MMQAFIYDGIRTPIGRYAGSLASVRADDLAALPLKAMQARHPDMDWHHLDEIILGCANQAGEDNRNIARMAGLLAGLADAVPGITVNRLCASGLDAVSLAARGIRAGDQHLVLAGGVESMSRAPFVIPKAAHAYSRESEIHDTTIGWRFVNPLLNAQYGIDSMPETADHVAAEFGILRDDQDAFAYRSQQRWKKAADAGFFDDEITPVEIPQNRSEPLLFTQDEHPRPNTSLEKLAALKGINAPELTVTPGNSSGVNDGAVVLLLGSEAHLRGAPLKNPLARVVCSASTGLEPRIMGMGPVNASRKALGLAKLSLEQIDVIEINEAFAAQALAAMRALGLEDTDPRVNAKGGAIALGHPLGMSGARLVLTAARQLADSQKRFALCTMCVGVGQGAAIILERV